MVTIFMPMLTGDGVYGDSDDEEFQGRSKTRNTTSVSRLLLHGTDLTSQWYVGRCCRFRHLGSDGQFTTLPRQNGVTISHFGALQTTTISMIRAIPMIHVQTSTVNIRV